MSTQNQKLESPIEGLNPLGFFGETSTKESCSVKVAVRIRPLLSKEILVGDSSCVRPNRERTAVDVGFDKSFTFDKVFGTEASQQEIFDTCVMNLVLSSFAGYNSTVLAYGQTSSGKTFTMGTDPVMVGTQEQQGIIPRVIKMMFEEVEKRKTRREFVIKASFIEIYNEEIRDLLDPQGQSKITIREFTRGVPTLCGQQEERVTDCGDLFKVLERGAAHRRTRSTMMNENSSRSHAILVVNIEQNLIADLLPESIPEDSQIQTEDDLQEFITAKFYFVDLAGSERIKKTGAEGEVLQEGISINKALFVLGKVINALTDESGKSSYKPYRESNLTRILQDSLGGNARTAMIACVSPADSNQEETLSTLMYACKARSIKNKPIVNSDPSSTLIRQLQQQVYDLQKELTSIKKCGGNVALMKEIAHEGSMENDLRSEIASLKRTNRDLRKKICEMEESQRKKEIDFLQTQKERDMAQLQYNRLKDLINKKHPSDVNEFDSELNDDLTKNIVERYREQIRELQEENEKRTNEVRELRKKYEEECHNSHIQSEKLFELNKELQQFKRTLFKMKKDTRTKQKDIVTQSNINIKNFANDPWLTADLSEQLKEIQDVFINELAQSLDTLVADTPRDSETKSDNEEDSNSDHSEESEETKKVEQIEMEEKLNRVDVDIREREKMLDQIKEKQKEMQKNLISIMEQQYHMKLAELEKEMEKFKVDQEKTMQAAPKDTKKAIEQQYKKKLSEYEGRIREYKKNEANQQRLLRQTNEQEGKIQGLTEEIAKMKQQRLEMMRKMKRERDTYEKNKRQQMKETLKLKQETIKQKLMITKLVNEKERMNKFKKKQLNSSDPTIDPIIGKEQFKDYRNLIEDFTNRIVNMRQESMRIRKEQQRHKDISSRLDLQYTKVCKLKLNIEKLALLKKEYNSVTDYDKIREIDESIEKIQQEINDHNNSINNLESTLNYHEEKLIKLEKTKNALRQQLANLLGRNRMKSAKDLNGLITVLFEVLSEEKIKRAEESIKMKTKQSNIELLNQQIQSLTETNEVLQKEFTSEIVKLKEEFEAKENTYKEELQLYAKSLHIDNSNSQNKVKNDQTKERFEDTNKDSFLKKELEEYKKRNTDIMKENSSLRNKVIELTGQNDTLLKTTAGLNRRIDELSSKLKKVDTLNKPTAHNLTSLNEYRMNRKKHQTKGPEVLTKSTIEISKDESKIKDEINNSEKLKKSADSSDASSSILKPVTLKSTTAKLVMCKPSTALQDSFGIIEESLDTNTKQSATNKNSVLIQRKSNNTELKASLANQSSGKFTGLWKCVYYTEESHHSRISSLVSFDQYLISASDTVKLWDINKKLTVSESPITSPSHLYVYGEQKVLIAANGQGLSFYLLPGLELIQTLKTELEVIHALHIDKNILFIGGSGTAGALQLWDIKTMTRLSAKEKEGTNNVHSILTKKSTIYYGGSNCYINRLSLDTLEKLPSLNPVHTEVVNGLMAFGTSFVSSCKNYLLRTWDYETNNEKYPEAKGGGTLTTIQTDRDKELLYTAGKDGNIKVWKVIDNKLQCVVDLAGHSKDINGLAQIAMSSGKDFASAGDDKSIRVWQFFE